MSCPGNRLFRGSLLEDPGECFPPEPQRAAPRRQAPTTGTGSPSPVDDSSHFDWRSEALWNCVFSCSAVILTHKNPSLWLCKRRNALM